MDILIRSGRDCIGITPDRVVLAVGWITGARKIDDAQVLWAGDWKGALTVVYSQKPSARLIETQILAWRDHSEGLNGVLWVEISRNDKGAAEIILVESRAINVAFGVSSADPERARADLQISRYVVR